MPPCVERSPFGTTGSRGRAKNAPKGHVGKPWLPWPPALAPRGVSLWSPLGNPNRPFLALGGGRVVLAVIGSPVASAAQAPKLRRRPAGGLPMGPVGYLGPGAYAILVPNDPSEFSYGFFLDFF